MKTVLCCYYSDPLVFSRQVADLDTYMVIGKATVVGETFGTIEQARLYAAAIDGRIFELKYPGAGAPEYVTLYYDELPVADL